MDTALSFVRQLREVFATQQEYVFYGSSLLLVYDAALGEQAPLHIKMIDFGHVHPWAPAEAPPAAGQAVAGNDGYLYAHPPRFTSRTRGRSHSLIACLCRARCRFGLDHFLEILEEAPDTPAEEIAWGASGRWGGIAEAAASGGIAEAAASGGG